MLHSQGDLVGGPPWFGELEMHLHRFWYHSLTPIFICMLFHVHLFIACLIVHYAYVMLIRLVLYMFSYLSTHVLYGPICCVLFIFHAYHRSNAYVFVMLIIWLTMTFCFDTS